MHFALVRKDRHLICVCVFAFFPAVGPILPQMVVFGKELGITPDVMGLITSILPILYVLAKPTVGYVIDSFPVSNLKNRCKASRILHILI